jgi:hypothetical protein
MNVLDKKNFSYICIVTVVFGIFFLFFTNIVSVDAYESTASQLNAFTGSKGADLGRTEDPRIIAGNVIRYALGFLGTLSIVYMLYAGFTIMTSGGVESKVEEGKKMIRNGAIGAALILSAYAIMVFVTSGIASSMRSSLFGSSRYGVEFDIRNESRGFNFCDQPGRGNDPGC